jgi:hypothetical protein
MKTSSNKDLPFYQPIHEVLTGVDAIPYGPLPLVPLPHDDYPLIHFISLFCQHLNGKELFLRDSTIVVVDEEKQCLEIMSPEAFCSWSQQFIRTTKFKKDWTGIFREVQKDMTTDVAKKVLAASLFRKNLREIEEISLVPVPIKAANGGICLAEPGYANGVYTFMYPGGNYDELSLEESVRLIRNLMNKFPFDDWEIIPSSDEAESGAPPLRQSRSLAVQVAAMLSMFCSRLLPDGCARMGFIYDANCQRSGKTLLAKIAIITSTGQFSGQTWNPNEESLMKVIDAQMLKGSPCICFDNVRNQISSPTIEGLMTSSFYTGRILGKTQMFTVKNRVSLFFTANSCTISSDMSHRCLVSRLFIEEGDVQQRIIDGIIDDAWLMDLENRRKILSSLWGIVRAWHEAGEPSASSYGYKPRLGFEKWGELIGGIVGFAGFGNPLEPDNSCDSEYRDLLILLEKLVNLSKGRSRVEFYVKEIVNLCREHDLFDWMLSGRNENGYFKLDFKSRSDFGIMLCRYAGDVDKYKKLRNFSIGGKNVKFGRRGTGGSRKYFIEI